MKTVILLVFLLFLSTIFCQYANPPSSLYIFGFNQVSFYNQINIKTGALVQKTDIQFDPVNILDFNEETGDFSLLATQTYQNVYKVDYSVNTNTSKSSSNIIEIPPTIISPNYTPMQYNNLTNKAYGICYNVSQSHLFNISIIEYDFVESSVNIINFPIYYQEYTSFDMASDFSTNTLYILYVSKENTTQILEYSIDTQSYINHDIMADVSLFLQQLYFFNGYLYSINSSTHENNLYRFDLESNSAEIVFTLDTFSYVYGAARFAFSNNGYLVFIAGTKIEAQIAYTVLNLETLVSVVSTVNDNTAPGDYLVLPV